MRHYTTHHRPGTHLTFHDRQILARDWNDRVRRGRMPSLREFREVRSVTTDNWCEFLDDAAIKAVVGCDVYYTRAYASWEKGSVENCNRLVETKQKGNRK